MLKASSKLQKSKPKSSKSPLNESNSIKINDLDLVIQRAKAAQKIYATFTQEQVDKIFFEAAKAANQARILLAKEAVAETNKGLVEDKVIKNHFAAEEIYNKYRKTKTCDLISEDKEAGIKKYAESIGVIAGIVPTTNPTSTAIFKSLITLKTRNAIIFSPHPGAKRCTIHAAQIISDAAVKAGAPEGLIGWIEEPTLEASNQLLHHPAISLILATGGPGMVKAAYSSGKPAIGVGAGNTPAIIDETADIKMAASSVLLSKTFDNGMICASEQSVVVVKSVYDNFKKEIVRQGAYLLSAEQCKKVGKIIMVDGRLNAAMVGQTAPAIAKLADIEVPDTAKILIGEVTKIGTDEPFSYEKLSTVLAMYKADDFESALDKAEQLIEFGGLGHTGVFYTDEMNQDRIDAFAKRIKAGRLLVNMPASQGAVGDLFNFRLEPSLTLGCGSHGGNSVSENVGVKHLINIKTVAERRENTLWFHVPPKIYFRRNCLGEALKDMIGKERAFIVTDRSLTDLGYADKVTRVLEEYGIAYEIFNDVLPDPTLETVGKGVERMRAFKPDMIIALGGGSPMDAGKIMWLMYEHPEVSFEDIAMTFFDIRKRICRLPHMGEKAKFIAIPTTSGTGSEVTPFAVITDQETGIKYPIADYALTPNMAIIDADFVMNMPRGLTAAGGYDAITHATEAFVAITSTEFSNPYAIQALELLFKYLPASYKEGGKNPVAREKVHYAATIAGMSFANGFLGICHSLAHKLGAAFHIPHGVANAIMITHVVKFNATDSPRKQGAFSQYHSPEAVERYAKIADAIGVEGSTPENKVKNFIKRLESLRAELNIPATIKEAGVSREEFEAKLDEMSELAFDDQCTGANPRYPSIEELKQLYIDAFEGK